MPLDPIGDFSYGDGTDDGTYVFPSSTEVVAYAIIPVPDPSNRTTSYDMVRIGVRWIVTMDDAEDDADTIDDVIDEIRQALRTVAGVLVFENTGLGSLSINGDSPTRDVVWGPKPGPLIVKPLGGGQAAELTWSLTVGTVLCSDGITDDSQPMELVYKSRREVDESGYTTRTLSFSVAIAQTRQTPQTRIPLASVDEWYESVLPSQIPGFRRRYGPVDISADGCRMTFDVVDVEEGPNYLPAGVVKASFGHSVGNQPGVGGLISWIGTFSGTYEMARDQPPENAWGAFFGIVKQRIQTAQQNFKPFTDKPGGDQINGVIVPLMFRMSEPDVYGKQLSQFQFSYSFQQSITNILKASGMWTPVSDDWDTWSVSLQNTALAPRGNAGLTDDPAGRAIIDLCIASGPSTLNTNSNLPPGIQAAIQDLVGNPPDPDNSWLVYENKLVSEDGQSVMLSTPLPTTQLQTAPTQSSFGIGDDPDGYDPSPYDNEPDSTVQVRAGGQYVYFLRGKCLRAQYDVSPPTLKSVNGVPVVPANRPDYGEGFATWAHSNLLFPITAANWNLRFVGTSAPVGAIAAPDTPILDGGATIDDDGDMTTDPDNPPSGGGDLF